MAERLLHPDTPELRERWGGFAWTEANAKAAAAAIAKYPEGRQQSAVIPLLDLAQRQVGEETGTQGWLPIPVQEFIAAELKMPPVAVTEVATFYTMFNLAPVGKFHVQVCGTTPCMLYVLAASSLGVYGVILAGWASNSKYPFFSAIRAAAQMVSYEVSIGFVLICVVLYANSFNLTDIVMASVGLPGTSNFVGEFLALVGTYKVSSWAAIVATTGIILGAAYMPFPID